MENLWKNLNLGDFVPVTTPPEEIIKQQCVYLNELTNGNVTAHMTSYSGPMSDYLQTYDPFAIINRFKPQSKEIDIQKDLGDVGNVPVMYFTYEFYITSPSTPDYKFRMMFFRYVLGQYPIKIVLDYDIARNIGEDEEVMCASENEFTMLLMRVFGSEKLKSVIIALNNIALQTTGQLLSK